MAATRPMDLLQPSSSDFSTSKQHPDPLSASSDLFAAPAVRRPPPLPVLPQPPPPPPSAEPLPGQSDAHSSAHSISRPRGLSTVSSTSSVHRKPLPSTASPLATRYSSSADRRDSIPWTGTITPRTIDSPTLTEHPFPAAQELLVHPEGETAREQSGPTEHKYRAPPSP